MPSTTTFLLATACLLCFLPTPARAFGAGEIPDFAYLNDKAFRHLDIENILVDIVRWKGSSVTSGGFINAALGALSGGGEKKFTKADVHRVYFGNWLRDYSQAMDIAGLSKATGETIVLLLSVLGFMTFGYATEEFELLADRLGVYLPVEHIDNPKGYGGNDDPRQFHPKLRPPVDQRELEIDPRTGMKNYIANDGQGWDTSAAHVRRSLKKAIALARQSGGHRSHELYEAYRLMGGALHTLEDLLAHSNWIELTMRKLGAKDVFPHVGDQVTVNAPGGERVPPLVTGTFGSADFIFSVMGEAGDKLSESSVSELSKKIADAKGKEESLSKIKSLLSQVPSGQGQTQNEMAQADEIQAKAFHFDPDNYTTEEVQQTLWQILGWRDRIMRKVSTIMEKIPGLEDLMDQLTDALNVYIYTTIEPYVKPVLGKASDAIGAGSRAVIDEDDQYEVFNNPNASDPSHSMISKDHFDNILNEPAGKIAKAVDEVAVNMIVAAWSDNNVDEDRTIEEILQALHHPYFARRDSMIQMAMAQTAEKWFNELGNDRQETIRRLTKESVKNGQNKRLGADNNTVMHSHTVGHQNPSRGYGGASSTGYGGATQQHSGQQHRQQAGEGYGSSYSQSGYGGREQETGYGRRQEQETGYGRRQEQETGYGRRQEQQREDQGYGGGEQRRTGGGGQEYSSYGEGRQQYGGRQETGYGRGQEQQREDQGYGSGEQRRGAGYGQEYSSYGEERKQTQYGGGQEEEHERHKHGQSHARREEQPTYGSGRLQQEVVDESSGYNTRKGYGGGDEEYSSRRAEYGTSGRNEYGSGRNEYGSSRDEYGGRGGDSGGNYGQTGYGQSGGYGQSEVSDQFERLNISRRDEGEGEGHHDHHRKKDDNESHHGRRKHHEEDEGRSYEYGRY